MEVIHSHNYADKTKSGVVVVDFYADWCGPCQMLTPVLEQLEEEMSDVTFYKVDVDQDKKLALAHDVLSIPVVLLLKDGQLVARTQGYSPKEMIQGFIKKAM